MQPLIRQWVMPHLYRSQSHVSINLLTFCVNKKHLTRLTLMLKKKKNVFHVSCQEAWNYELKSLLKETIVDPGNLQQPNIISQQNVTLPSIEVNCIYLSATQNFILFLFHPAWHITASRHRKYRNAKELSTERQDTKRYSTVMLTNIIISKELSQLHKRNSSTTRLQLQVLYKPRAIPEYSELYLKVNNSTPSSAFPKLVTVGLWHLGRRVFS